MKVTNAPAFKKFQSKRKLWRDCMSGNDISSVYNQISDMMWDASIWHVINHSRQYAGKRADGRLSINGPAHNLINRCFFDQQMLSLRRLVDKAGLYGEGGVHSLGSVLQDMVDNSHLLTREHFLADEKVPFDLEPIKQAQAEWSRTCPSKEGELPAIPRKLMWQVHEYRHGDLDRLCGVGPETRSPHDLVRVELLTRLQKMLADACEDVKTYVDKRVAHAATPDSRRVMDEKAASLTLGHIKSAQKVVCRVAGFVDLHLVSNTGHVGLVPSPTFNHLEDLDHPLVPSGRMPSASDAWREFREETSSWRSLAFEELQVEE